MSDVLVEILKIVAPAIVGFVLALLTPWLKSLAIVKRLNLENLVDVLAEKAIHLAEEWGRTAGASGAAKMKVAREKFAAALQRHGIKLSPQDVQDILDATFNRIKSQVEHIEDFPVQPIQPLAKREE